jgi:GxxExxY protein
MKTEDEINKITEKIIGACYTVSNTLGAGFLEKVYENSLVIELRKPGIKTDQQKSVDVFYDQTLVGEHYADLLAEDEIIVELKAVKSFDNNHQAQLMNYLKAGHKRYGLLINFGNPKVEIKRIVNGY